MNSPPAPPDHWRLQAISDLHDVFGNGITVIYLQAAAALRNTGNTEDDSEQLIAALDTIKAASKELATEVRAIVNTLYAAEPVPVTAGLHRVATLAEEMRVCGLAVDLEVSGEGPVPADVDLAAYRIVQESLTNVLRHARPTTAIVRIVRGADAVLLEITNARPDRAGHTVPWHGGHGIAGMRERAETLGGSLQAEALPDGGFRVHSRLPTTRPDHRTAHQGRRPHGQGSFQGRIRVNPDVAPIAGSAGSKHGLREEHHGQHPHREAASPHR